MKRANKKTNGHLIFRAVSLIIVIALAVMIFCLSAQPAVESEENSDGVCVFLCRIFVKDFGKLNSAEAEAVVTSVSGFVRKAAHFTEYFLLGLFVYFFASTFGKKPGFVIPVSFLSGAFYACTDEFHQFFVEGRSAQISDVLIDSAGTLAGVLAAFAVLLLITKRGAKTKR